MTDRREDKKLSKSKLFYCFVFVRCCLYLVIKSFKCSAVVKISSVYSIS